MNGSMTPLFRWTGRLALVMMLVQPGFALAQGQGAQRRLGPGDEIAVSVPGRPDLDGELTLDASGRVSIEPVGEISLADLTVAEAAEVLRRNLRLFYPNLDNLEVQLRSASEVTLYVIGAFRTPGHYAFAIVPTLWELVRLAGGPADDADLRMARPTSSISIFRDCSPTPSCRNSNCAAATPSPYPAGRVTVGRRCPVSTASRSSGAWPSRP